MASVEAEREYKKRETELAEQLATARAQLCEVGAAAARAKEEQLSAVLVENQAVSERGR